MGRIRYTQGPGQWGQLISQHNSDTGQTRYYGFDHTSNTRFLANSGSVTDSYSYKAFGEPVTSSGSTPNPMRYGGEVGYYRDKIERVYVRARHYEPPSGRWLNRDPIGYQGQDWNLYRYVLNNPNSWIDPSGLSFKASGINCDKLTHDCFNMKRSIEALARELVDRYQEMRNDLQPSNPYPLYPFRPGPNPQAPHGTTWPGHQDQYKDVQKRLQKCLDKFNDENCSAKPNMTLPDLAPCWRTAPNKPKPAPRPQYSELDESDLQRLGQLLGTSAALVAQAPVRIMIAVLDVLATPAY